MTIQRQYSLPNCKLVVEGWGDKADDSSNFMDSRPVMTILVNAECYIEGREQPLSGGREFLEGLVASVSQYAQQFLSGVPHALTKSSNSLMQFQTTDDHRHRLTLRQSQDHNGAAPNPETIQIDLSTVQLFDLVEAVDQLVADAQTLPDLSLNLVSVPKRHVAPQESVVERTVPAALGISGLAVAAIAFFFIPPPEIRPTSQEESVQQEQSIDASTDTETPGASPNTEDAATDETSDVDESNAGSDDELGAASEAEENDDPDAAFEPQSNRDTRPSEIPDQDEIEEFLTSAPPIADTEQLNELTADLRDRLQEEWDTPPTFDEDLIYRVGVSEEGDILGFKFENDSALDYLDEIPLLDLTELSFEPEAETEEPIGQFRVVFKPSGVIEVSPWYGRPQSSDSN